LGHLSLDRKTYLARMVLGSATVTEDVEGETLSTAAPDDVAAVTEAEVTAAIASWIGQVQQVASAVSAVKVDGKRAYERVRDGEHVELAPRPVTVHRFELLNLRRTGDSIELDALVECSSGTYVRALARDLGAALGVGGHLNRLRRTTVGPFTLSGARTLEQFDAEPQLTLGLDAAVDVAFPRRDVDADLAWAVRHGQRMPRAGIDGTYGVFDPDGRVLALSVDEESQARSVVVLAPA